MKIAASRRSGVRRAPIGPRRIQRARQKGIRTAEGAIYVGRPSVWTNPFRSERFGHVRAIRLHGQWLAGELSPRRLQRLGFSQAEVGALYRLRRTVLDRIGRLAGRDLECWCPTTSRHCHANLLLALANGSIVAPGIIS